MRAKYKSNCGCRRGVAYVLALLLLAIFSTLSVAMVGATDLNLRKSENWRQAQEARLAAESGMDFAAYTLKTLQSEGYWEGQPDMLAIAYDYLAGRLEGTGNLEDEAVSLSEAVLSVPSISLGQNGSSFSFTLTQIDETTIRLTVTGSCGSCTRKLSLDYQIKEDTRVMHYAVASSSRIFITDEAVIDGDVCSNWTQTYICGYEVPPFLMEEGTSVIGQLKTVMSQSEFEEYNSDDCIEGDHEGLGYNEPDFGGYTTDDFNTSSYKEGTTNITTLDPPDYWLNQDPFPDASNYRRRIDRPVYENRTFDNVYVPVGYNPKFINCTFQRIIYVDVDETKTLEDWPHSQQHYVDPNEECSNNVIFESCTFEGAVVTGVPRSYWWTQNALTFEGETTFTNDYMPESTIMAPNFGVDIGGRGYDSEDNPDSKLTGIIVGGIVDIRGTAYVEGTILSMFCPGEELLGSSARYYGTNIGYYYDGGECGDAGIPGNICIVPTPEYQLPYGIRQKYTIKAMTSSYKELKP